MQIQIQSPGHVLPQAVSDRLRRRLDFALDRFAHVLDQVRVLVVREGRGRDDGPAPHRAKLLLRPRDGRSRIVVSAVAGDVSSAVGLAGRRAARALRRGASRRLGRFRRGRSTR